MQEIKGIAAWLAEHEHHPLNHVETLPSPTFEADGRRFVSFSTNNYLALASHPRLVAAARKGLSRYGVGNCESRLLGGNLEIYDALERKLAALKGTESAILFATGYLTNLGVLSTLPRFGQYARVYGYKSRGVHSYCYFGDEYNHLSIREGMRMSGAERKTYRHCDLDHLESLLKDSQVDTRIIVTDGVFSQDGDIADLPGLLALAERYDAMVYVDDAHGTGLLGEHGGGISEHFGVSSPRLIHMGTLSKAYGAIGGYVAADEALTKSLRLACSAYGFTSALPPDQTLAISEALDIVKNEPDRRKRLWDNQRYFVSRMRGLPYALVSHETPIIPIMIGREGDADRVAEQLQAERINVDAVKFPAVPLRKARLRVQLNAGHTRQQIDHLVDVLASVREVKTPSRFGAVLRRPRTQGSGLLAAFEQLGARIRSAPTPFQTGFSRVNTWATATWGDVGLTLNFITFFTAVLMTIDITTDIPHLIFGYLIPVLFVAKRFGNKAGLSTTILVSLCATLMMYEPGLDLQLVDQSEVFDLIAFCSVATVMCQILGTPAKRGAVMRAS